MEGAISSGGERSQVAGSDQRWRGATAFVKAGGNPMRLFALEVASHRVIHVTHQLPPSPPPALSRLVELERRIPCWPCQLLATAGTAPARRRRSAAGPRAIHRPTESRRSRPVLAVVTSTLEVTPPPPRSPLFKFIRAWRARRRRRSKGRARYGPGVEDFVARLCANFSRADTYLGPMPRARGRRPSPGCSLAVVAFGLSE